MSGGNWKDGEVTVSCDQHGTMTYDERLQWWACSGWAGEGCLTGMIVTAEQARRLKAPSGTTITIRKAG
jgi:hypothetical protein